MNRSATRVSGRLRTSSPSTGKKSGGVAGFAAGKTTELKQAAQFKNLYSSLPFLVWVFGFHGMMRFFIGWAGVEHRLQVVTGAIRLPPTNNASL